MSKTALYPLSLFFLLNQFGPAIAQDSFETASSDVQQLENPVEPLVPRVQRSEAEQDRLEALSLFAAGRMLEQERKHSEALAMYQRAARFDQDNVTLLRQIVPLSFSLSRTDEALRYAAKLALKDNSDPVLIRKVASVLAEQGDHKTAIALFDKLLQLEKPDSKNSPVMLRMELGRLHFLNKDFSKAAKCFAEVQAALADPVAAGIEPAQLKLLTSEKGVALELFAEAFLESKRFADAQAAFDKLNEISPNPGLYLLHQARVAAAQGEQGRGLSLLEQYFAAKEPSLNTEPFALLDKLLAAAQRENELVSRLEELLKAAPDDVWLKYYLAEQYQESGNYPAAIKLYEELLAAKPSVEVYQGLLKGYLQLSEYDALIKVLADPVKKGSTLEPFGEPLQSLIDNKAALMAVFESTRQYHAHDEQANIDRAATLLAIEAKDFDRAAEFYDRASRISKESLAQIVLLWGIELLQADRPADAVTVFKRGLDEQLLPKDNPAFEYYLAGALELDGKTGEAVEAAKRAVAAQPSSAVFHGRIGWIYYHAGRYDEALDAYRKLLDKFGQEHTSSQVREAVRDSLLIMSNIYVLQGNVEKAEEPLERVLNEFPDDVGASNDLGYLWADAGKHLRQALRLIEHAVDADPENKAYRDSLGWVLFRLGRFSEAKAELLKAVDGEADGVILEHLAEVQLKLGEQQAAEQTFGQAIAALEKEDRPDTARIDKLKQRLAELEPTAAQPSS